MKNVESVVLIILGLSISAAFLTAAAAVFWIVFGWPPLQCP